MLNNFNTLPKGNNNMYSHFGFGTTSINGLTIHTVRLTCNTDEDFHLAFMHTAGKTPRLFRHSKHSTNKKTGRESRKTIFTYATTSIDEMKALRLAYDNAKILIMEWEIEQLRAAHNKRLIVMPEWRKNKNNGPF